MNEDTDLAYRSDPNFTYKSIEVKSFDGDTMQAYCSTADKDSYGDIVELSAWDDWLKQFNDNGCCNDMGGFKAKVFLYLNHNPSMIAGYWTDFKIDDKGLLGTAKIMKNTRCGQDLIEYRKEGLIENVSVGFLVKDSQYEENADEDEGTLYIKEAFLLECSAVAYPANPNANMTKTTAINLKTDGKIDVQQTLNIARNRIERSLRKETNLTQAEAKRFASCLSADGYTDYLNAEDRKKRQDMMDLYTQTLQSS